GRSRLARQAQDPGAAPGGAAALLRLPSLRDDDCGRDAKTARAGSGAAAGRRGFPALPHGGAPALELLSAAGQPAAEEAQQRRTGAAASGWETRLSGIAQGLGGSSLCTSQ